MATEQDKSSSKQDNLNVNTPGGTETPVEDANRRTGVPEKSGGKATAAPESPENDTVVGGPNQGTESR
jgi:hypothetical protein